MVKCNGECEPLYHEYGVVKEVRCRGQSHNTMRVVVQHGVYREQPRWCVLVSAVIVDSCDSMLVELELVVDRTSCTVARSIVTQGVVSASSLVGVVYPWTRVKGAER